MTEYPNDSDAAATGAVVGGVDHDPIGVSERVRHLHARPVAVRGGPRLHQAVFTARSVLVIGYPCALGMATRWR
jgi:hypothetical protein